MNKCPNCGGPSGDDSKQPAPMTAESIAAKYAYLGGTEDMTPEEIAIVEAAQERPSVVERFRQFGCTDSQCDCCSGMEASAQGEWVQWADFQGVAAEAKRLRADRAALLAKLEDMRGDFKGYAWDNGAGAAGFDEAIDRVRSFVESQGKEVEGGKK